MMAIHYHCLACDGVMDEAEATTTYREVHTELEDHPSEWITELRCIYCGAGEQYLEELG